MAETRMTISGEWADFGLTHVQFEVGADGVAVALLNVRDETMNVIAEGLAEDLELVFTRVRRDPSIRALVVGSAKSTGFLAGADIKMLDKLTNLDEAVRGSKEAQAGMNRLEALWKEGGKPVVAAIHGPCLGGGLELALACQYRVLSDSAATKLGLPEVKIGLVPGAGGTQRLPALIGIANGLDHILTGKNCWARKALKIGLAEEVVPEAILLDVARRRAMEAADARRPPAGRGRPLARGRRRDLEEPGPRGQPPGPAPALQEGQGGAARPDSRQLPGPRAGLRGRADWRRGGS